MLILSAGDVRQDGLTADLRVAPSAEQDLAVGQVALRRAAELGLGVSL